MSTESVTERLATAARAALQSVGTAPFSEAGFQALEAKIELYIDDLILESVRVMERQAADVVSPHYVHKASEALASGRRSKAYVLVGTIGGILLGAAVSSFVDMAKSQAVTVAQAVTAGVLGIVGATLIALQFARE